MLRALASSDIYKRDDHAANVIVLRTVGPGALQVPMRAVTEHLGFERYELRQHTLSICDEIAIRELLSQMRNGPTDVGGKQPEQILDRWREPTHSHLRVEKHDCNVSAAQQVVEVVCRGLELTHLGF